MSQPFSPRTLSLRYRLARAPSIFALHYRTCRRIGHYPRRAALLAAVVYVRGLFMGRR